VSLVVVVALIGHLDAGPRPLEPRDVGVDAGSADAGTLVDAGPTTASGLVMTARVEPDPAPFGGRFELVVEITRPGGEPLTLPGTIPESDVCARSGDPRRTVQRVDEARVKETIRIPYLALDTQDVKTPALLLTARDGSTLDVPALPVRVDVPPDTGPDGGPLVGPDGGPVQPGQVALEPAATTLAYRVPDQRPWVLVSALVSTLLTLLIVRAVQKRMRLRAPPAPAAPPPPPRPAHEVALERLEALLASGLLARGETGTFVERLMDEVLRDYLAARFALDAGSRTTRELVKELLGITVAGLDVALVDELLKDADLVKFAKASIASERAHAMATRVRTLVEATAMKPPAEAAP
jgi:hypothetical protein